MRPFYLYCAQFYLRQKDLQKAKDQENPCSFFERISDIWKSFVNRFEDRELKEEILEQTRKL